MLLRTALALICLAANVPGQGTTPKKVATEYPQSARFADFELGVEYMVRSFGSQDRLQVTDDFLTIELAIYPIPGRTATVDSRAFRLRLNNKREPLMAQSAGSVAASIKYADWRQRPNIQVGAGPINIGGTQPSSRFPGDRRPDQNRLPQPPGSTTTSDAKTEPEDPAVLLQQIGLPEGPAKHPVSGFLFFPYEGKLKSVKKVDLLVTVDGEEKVISLK